MNGIATQSKKAARIESTLLNKLALMAHPSFFMKTKPSE